MKEIQDLQYKFYDEHWLVRGKFNDMGTDTIVWPLMFHIKMNIANTTKRELEKEDD